MSNTGPEALANGPSARTYIVPRERIVSIEHPCIVKSFNNGFRSLGGEHQLKHVLEHQVGESKTSKKNSAEPIAGVSLRPNDPLAKKLSSTGTQTRNVLIKVTVPKRTGRKRKRGSNDPFTEPASGGVQSDTITAPELLQRLRDNADRYGVQAIGSIRETHRFRDLPDFQVRADEVPVMREIRDHAVEPNYDKLKAFRANFKPETNATSAFPGPPSFAGSGQFHRNEFQRSSRNRPNPVQKQTEKVAKPRKPKAHGTLLNTEPAPFTTPTDLADATEESVSGAIIALKQLLKERPIAAKRVFSHLHPEYSDRELMEAIPYAGYLVNSGPWRTCIIKYGVDPRRDPQHRFYQTVGLAPRTTQTNGTRQEQASYIFDGQSTGGGRVWQFCDLTDSTLHHLVHNEEVRATCEPQQWGWYQNGTMAKIRVILRDKVGRLNGEAQLLPESDYMTIAALPSIFNDSSERDYASIREKPHLRPLAQNVAREVSIRDLWISREAGQAEEEPEVSLEASEPNLRTAVDEEGDYVEGEADAAGDRAGLDELEALEGAQHNGGDDE